ncbi:MAG: DUF1640 domain-containing protein [Chloroflexi bacterium]|nr:DUF1640 domain-containing protein [Chloroflexota bacterium]
MTQAAIPFDTHRFVRNLVASGFTEKQAEALADEHVNLINSNLATKTDIESVRADIEALRLSTESKIETLRFSTEANIASSKFEMVKWMIGAMIAQSAVIVTLSVSLSKLL